MHRNMIVTLDESSRNARSQFQRLTLKLFKFFLTKPFQMEKNMILEEKELKIMKTMENLYNHACVKLKFSNFLNFVLDL